MINAGDFLPGQTVQFMFSTNAAAGGAVAPSSAFEAADLVIYKGASATQRSSANGITMTSPFDSVVGQHHVAIDLTDNTDAGFWEAHFTYHVMLAPDETVDSQTIVVPLAMFSIMARGSMRRATAGVVSSAVAAPTTTNFRCADITEATASHFLGQSVYPYTGNLIKQRLGVITAYSLVSSEGSFTFTGNPAGETIAAGDRVLIM